MLVRRTAAILKCLQQKSSKVEAALEEKGILFWENHVNGQKGHGSLIPKRFAQDAARYSNKKYPFIFHQVFTLEEILTSPGPFNPFRPK